MRLDEACDLALFFVCCPDNSPAFSQEDDAFRPRRSRELATNFPGN